MNWRMAIFTVLLTWFWFCIPSQLFHAPTSFVLSDYQGKLLSASIAADGQWRFPANGPVPEKFARCITTFEDKRFFYHPGFDPLSIGRAVWQNVRRRKVVSGGSTLTMQVVRLSRRKNRSFFQKFIEVILALRTEVRYDKQQILSLYAANAPFGSNVVGLDAAAWRYFGRNADQLSWGEMAALAVLPNAPTLIHPGKNRSLLLIKRNLLLDKLYFQNIIDRSTCELSKLEELPGKPMPLPMLATHLLERFKKDYRNHPKQNFAQSTSIISTLHAGLQQKLTFLVNRYYNTFKGNGINNAAAMVMHIETGNVLAYVGNVSDDDPEAESQVDILSSVRSPGSTLKPLLFAAMQADGLILPKQLIADIPTQLGGYTPQNFNLEYDGAVPANRALSRSLNIPAVKMLQQYKYQRFYDVLQQCGFTTVKKPADFYGLSLILGGCEITPWELAAVYSNLARTYNHQRNYKGVMTTAGWQMPNYIVDQDKRVQSGGKENRVPFLDFTSLWHTFNAMQEVMRPGEEGLWNLFSSAQRIAWKTGTSFGFRDGWAIGFNREYCVTVWVGNADGEGRPGLTGISTAAPVLFDIFRMLPASRWFEPPVYDFTYLPVCRHSGFKAGTECEQVDTVLVSAKGKNAGICPYHRIIHLDATGKHRVTENCAQPFAMLHSKWFVLPPAMEFYYRQQHPDYKMLPSFLPGCGQEGFRQMELIYPENNARIYVPLEISGQRGNTIFTAAHRNPEAKIFWHLNNQYVGTTTRFHQFGLNPPAGKHRVTIVDEQGETITRSFEILEKNR